MFNFFFRYSLGIMKDMLKHGCKCFGSNFLKARQKHAFWKIKNYHHTHIHAHSHTHTHYDIGNTLQVMTTKNICVYCKHMYTKISTHTQSACTCHKHICLHTYNIYVQSILTTRKIYSNEHNTHTKLTQLEMYLVWKLDWPAHSGTGSPMYFIVIFR